MRSQADHRDNENFTALSNVNWGQNLKFFSILEYKGLVQWILSNICSIPPTVKLTHNEGTALQIET